MAEGEGCTAPCVHTDVLSSTFQSNDNQFLWELIGGPPKTRNVSACWQDGRFFAENETWVVDSCTKCTCKVSQPRSPGAAPGWAAKGLGQAGEMPRSASQGEEIMELPVLNFKFLPDRCHWGRNSSCLQRQEGGGRGGPWRAPHSLGSGSLSERCLEPHASTLCKALSQPSAQPRCRQQPGWGGRRAHALVTGEWWCREVEACTQVTQHVSRRAKFQSRV